MPTEKEQVEKVDHAYAARHGLQIADECEGMRTLEWAATAQVHASLAIAEQLVRLNETLEAISEPTAGQFDGALRVRNA
jgi:hypothetical protein